VLADAIEATLPQARAVGGLRLVSSSESDARLFAESGADALRTSIARACSAAEIPLSSPHDLRHRRISLLHLRGVPWARIGEFVGQRSLSVTADVYSHVLADETEVDTRRYWADERERTASCGPGGVLDVGKPSFCRALRLLPGPIRPAERRANRRAP
jgi:integrase